MDIEQHSSDGNRIETLFFLVVGAVIGASGMSIYRDHAERAEQKVDKHEPLTIGSGGVLRAPGVVVLYGPVTIEDEHATFPIYVPARAKDDVVASCLLLDERKRLVDGIGIPIPPRLAGANIRMELSRNITAGSLQCQLVKP